MSVCTHGYRQGPYSAKNVFHRSQQLLLGRGHRFGVGSGFADQSLVLDTWSEIDCEL